MGASDAALVKSGHLDARGGADAAARWSSSTASRWLTYLVGRLLVRMAHFALVNILAGRRLVPELLQGEASPERMAAEIERLLGDRRRPRGAARGARARCAPRCGEPGRAAAGGRRGRARDGRDAHDRDRSDRAGLHPHVRRAREPRADRSRRSSPPTPDVDVLVVDDNSPDGTGELADELAAREPRVHVLHRPGSRGSARRTSPASRGRSSAATTLVLEMDADFSPRPALPAGAARPRRGRRGPRARLALRRRAAAP